MPRFKPFPAVNAKQKVPEGTNVESSCFHRCFSIVSDSPREPGGRLKQRRAAVLWFPPAGIPFSNCSDPHHRPCPVLAHIVAPAVWPADEALRLSGKLSEPTFSWYASIFVPGRHGNDEPMVEPSSWTATSAHNHISGTCRNIPASGSEPRNPQCTVVYK